MKPNSIARGPVRAEPQDESATPGPLQAVERRAAQSSAMPEGLRNLADKLTARKQIHAASNLSGQELLMAASNPNLNGRGARALQREIAHRRATNTPATTTTTPPAPATAPAQRKSALPNAMRGMLDKVTARTQTAQAAALSDAELADRLAGPAPQVQREARALQREAAKRQA
uniref:hypothetical protein n=1 Tax=Burkholderia sp. Ac-20379 TaxID=2703900 RepID=UPI00197F4F4F